ncbi:MAG: SDR family oxidoreductase [Rhodospirillaceae bacterium]|nr:SDR family oxidoreductase [Rhodospirillaceae bacterium]MBT4038640.1 SDR family oxidoreductase [Rhodospirillales bacterium]MBT4627085.1 SDR family oxidoreductase [Rhodospirillales bacterium]MBT5350637.1 SDR family oxidoreductase [Rhodospirillales bacterium]MBT5521494.1 SDR family oxidoreductase [Rhodospirillales bacterium]
MSTNLFDLSGKGVAVTGAGRGLGAAMAKGLAAAGASVMCAARTLSEVEDTAHAILDAGGDARAMQVDATERAACSQLVTETVSAFGHLDAMVVNHGVGGVLTAEDIDEDHWHRIVNINLTGCFNCAQAAGQQMIKQGHGGSIIMTSSNASLVGFKGLTAYGASKAGVDQLARQLAVDWGEHNIRVNTINPGEMTHKMQHRQSGKKSVAHTDTSADDSQFDLTPLGREGDPSELVGPVIFLASNASSFITGHSIPVDGGFTIF